MLVIAAINLLQEGTFSRQVLHPSSCRLSRYNELDFAPNKYVYVNGRAQARRLAHPNHFCIVFSLQGTAILADPLPLLLFQLQEPATCLFNLSAFTQEHDQSSTLGDVEQVGSSTGKVTNSHYNTSTGRVY